MNLVVIAIAAAAALVNLQKPPSKPPNWNAPETVYLDIPHQSGIEISNGWNRAFSTKAPRRGKNRPHSRDFIGGPILACGNLHLRCFEGIVTLAIDTVAIAQNRHYEAADVDFVPTCLYRPALDYCGLTVVKYEGRKSSQVEGTAGFFVYEAGFGVRSFAGADPKTGNISGVFSYASGQPLLAK